MLPDWKIRELALQGMITPFEEGYLRPGVISYGVTSYGYDIRLSRRQFKVFTNSHGNVIIDPKDFDERSFVTFKDQDFFVVPPNSFALGETEEVFDIPRFLVCDVIGKSTYARCGIIVNITPLEPEWRGKLTVEFSNTTPLPAKLYAGEGVGQMRFFPCSEKRLCEVSYKDKNGKYQDQKGLTLPCVIR